jgi:hypothetical protein
MRRKNIRPIFLRSLACLVLVLLAACTSNTYIAEDAVVGGTTSQVRPLTTIPGHLGDSNPGWVPGTRRLVTQPQYGRILPPPH